jgi:hypothetical protein
MRQSGQKENKSEKIKNKKFFLNAIIRIWPQHSLKLPSN